MEKSRDGTSPLPPCAHRLIKSLEMRIINNVTTTNSCRKYLNPVNAAVLDGCMQSLHQFLVDSRHPQQSALAEIIQQHSVDFVKCEFLYAARRQVAENERIIFGPPAEFVGRGNYFLCKDVLRKFLTLLCTLCFASNNLSI